MACRLRWPLISSQIVTSHSGRHLCQRFPLQVNFTSIFPRLCGLRGPACGAEVERLSSSKNERAQGASSRADCDAVKFLHPSAASGPWREDKYYDIRSRVASFILLSLSYRSARSQTRHFHFASQTLRSAVVSILSRLITLVNLPWVFGCAGTWRLTGLLWAGLASC